MTWAERRKCDKIKAQIERQIRDAKSAAHEYSQLVYNLNQIKEVGLADRVRTFAADEARHYTTLTKLLKEL